MEKTIMQKQEPGMGSMQLDSSSERIGGTPQNKSSKNTAQTKAPKRSKNDLIMVVFFLLAVNVVTFLTAAFLIYGNQQSLDEAHTVLSNSDLRIQQLENKLLNTGENQQANLALLQVSVNEMQTKLDSFAEQMKVSISENDKHWANYRKHRDSIKLAEANIDSLFTTTATTRENLLGAQSDVEKAQQTLSGLNLTNRFSAVNVKIETLEDQLIDVKSVANSAAGERATKEIEAKVADLTFQLQFLKEDLQLLQSANANSTPSTP
jgi:hypothetical protein